MRLASTGLLSVRLAAGSNPYVAPWILITGFWADTGDWDDDAVWID